MVAMNWTVFRSHTTFLSNLEMRIALYVSDSHEENLVGEAKNA